MLRLSALTSSFRALSVSRVSAGVASASAGARAGIIVFRLANQIHTTAVYQDKATGTEPVGESPVKPRAPRKKATEGSAKPKKKVADGAAAAPKPKKPSTKDKGAPTKKATEGGEVAEKKVKKPVKVKTATPPRPKRVLHPPKLIRSAWLLYYKERCAELPADEKKSVVELSQKLVEEFRKLSTDDREALDGRLKDMQAEYAEKLEAWRNTVTPQMIIEENEYRREQRKHSTKKANQRLFRDPTEPRQPINGYIRYCEYVRHNPEQCEKILGTANQGEIVAIEQAKALSAGWKALTDAERAPYNEAYQTDKAAYLKDHEAWKKENGITSA